MSPSNCTEWQGSTRGKGYGQVWCPRRKRQLGAHIVAWEQANGKEVPQGLVVMHACDNPPCVNPAHLLLGTVADNNRDMARKSRAVNPPRRPQRGGLNNAAKLSEDDVREIKRASGTQAEVGAEFGVSRSAVCLIKQGKRWGHVAI